MAKKSQSREWSRSVLEGRDTRSSFFLTTVCSVLIIVFIFVSFSRVIEPASSEEFMLLCPSGPFYPNPGNYQNRAKNEPVVKGPPYPGLRIFQNRPITQKTPTPHLTLRFAVPAAVARDTERRLDAMGLHTHTAAGGVEAVLR